MIFDLSDPLGLVLPVARALVIVSIFLALFRVWRGPRTPDRVVALDTVSYLAIASCALTAIETGDELMLRPALPLALLTFLAVVAFARYLEKRAMER